MRLSVRLSTIDAAHKRRRRKFNPVSKLGPKSTSTRQEKYIGV